MSTDEQFRDEHGLDPTLGEPVAKWALVVRLPDDTAVCIEFFHSGAPLGSVPEIGRVSPEGVVRLGTPCPLDEIGYDVGTDPEEPGPSIVAEPTSSALLLAVKDSLTDAGLAVIHAQESGADWTPAVTSTLDQIGEALHDCQQRLTRAIFGSVE